MALVRPDEIRLSEEYGAALIFGKTCGLLTDTLVSSNSTVTLLKAAIDAAFVHAEYNAVKPRVKQALDFGVNQGDITETHGVTTVDGLIALTQASPNYLNQGRLLE